MLADALVRLAVPADAGAIAAMSREYIEHGLPWSWLPARVERAIRNPDTNVAVVDAPDAPGTLAAFGIMSYRESDAHLLLFAVHHRRRREGLGSALLLWLEEVARTGGARRIRVEARWDNVAARNFYSEHGYHERTLRKAMYSGTLDGVLLEKWLVADNGGS
ncbi:GNAT family N-acetyltransferase [Ramlibacter montanisoli]|uniref:GNAT family N-acetyltransferase n=1 Tax=Ramlibacter montanisoli TaxID=2732512 RepID=A0A849KB98_9BURK|nr:GNAT family N-acetyltransferase [Ramlibacter montanisoli]NNU43417.1 GNAT family N-acetyltransferase [Ramlibacter montanisoli]